MTPLVLFFSLVTVFPHSVSHGPTYKRSFMKTKYSGQKHSGKSSNKIFVKTLINSDSKTSFRLFREKQTKGTVSLLSSTNVRSITNTLSKLLLQVSGRQTCVQGLCKKYRGCFAALEVTADKGR